MNCERYVNMLFLYRDGELSSDQTEELIQHVRRCETCRRTKERIDTLEAFLDRIRLFTPVIAEPDVMIAAIMSKVRSSAMEPVTPGFFEQFLNFFVLPKVRLASASIIASVIVIFLIQYLTLFANVRSLEVTARLHSGGASHSEGFYAVRSAQALDLTRAKGFRKLIPPNEYEIKDGQILVAKRDVASLLSICGIRSVSSFVTSSVLRIDERKVKATILEISKNYSTVTDFVH